MALFPFNKPLLSTSSVPGTVLTPESSEADKKSLCPQAAHSLAKGAHSHHIWESGLWELFPIAGNPIRVGSL